MGLCGIVATLLINTCILPDLTHEWTSVSVFFTWHFAMDANFLSDSLWQRMTKCNILWTKYASSLGLGGDGHKLSTALVLEVQLTVSAALTAWPHQLMAWLVLSYAFNWQISHRIYYLSSFDLPTLSAFSAGRFATRLHPSSLFLCSVWLNHCPFCCHWCLIGRRELAV